MNIRAHNDNKYKVKTVKKGDDPQAALAGNRSMQLHDVYKAVVGDTMTGHHNADADVDAAIAIAVDDAVWKRRYLSLANHNGVYLLKEREEDIMKLFEKSKAEVHHNTIQVLNCLQKAADVLFAMHALPP